MFFQRINKEARLRSALRGVAEDRNRLAKRAKHLEKDLDCAVTELLRLRRENAALRQGIVLEEW